MSLISYPANACSDLAHTACLCRLQLPRHKQSQTGLFRKITKKTVGFDSEILHDCIYKAFVLFSNLYGVRIFLHVRISIVSLLCQRQVVRVNACARAGEKESDRVEQARASSWPWDRHSWLHYTPATIDIAPQGLLGNK